MKRFLILLIIAVAPLFSSFAQNKFYIGGSVGASFSKNTQHETRGNQSRYGSVSISPEFGYNLKNDRWIIGTRLWYSYSKSNNGTSVTVNEDGTTLFEEVINYSTIGINPFTKFRCFNAGPVGFWLKGGFSYYYSFNRGYVRYYDQNVFDVGITPEISWKPFEHFSFFTDLNCLSLRYTYACTLSQGNSSTTSSFRFGADSQSLLTLDEITIGLRYWF